MLDKIFLVAAVIGGTIMVCQFVLTLLGMDDDLSGDGAGDVGGSAEMPDGGLGGSHYGAADVGVGDHGLGHAATSGDVHHPDSSWLFGIISFRTLVGAAAFFGVAGKAAISAGLHAPAALMIALAAGFGAMYGMYWLMQAISRLQSSGNERITAALGRRATVYIPIPAEGKGVGKVQLSMQNRIVEFQAVTDEGDRLKTGEAVEVVAITGSDTVRVRRVAAAVEV